MKILFDQGVPLPLSQGLSGMEVTTAYRMSWSKLSNGALLAAAEQAGMDVFVTTDQNLRYQQNLKDRRIAVVVLPTTRWPDIQSHAGEIKATLEQTKPGSYLEMTW